MKYNEGKNIIKYVFKWKDLYEAGHLSKNMYFGMEPSRKIKKKKKKKRNEKKEKKIHSCNISCMHFLYKNVLQ